MGANVLDRCDVLDALNYIDAADGLVKSAAMLADAVVAQLENAATVTVDVSNLRSVSSSYFNMLLLQVAQKSGIDAVKTRLKLNYASPAQKAIFDRSYQAVLANSGR